MSVTADDHGPPADVEHSDLAARGLTVQFALAGGGGTSARSAQAPTIVTRMGRDRIAGSGRRRRLERGPQASKKRGLPRSLGKG